MPSAYRSLDNFLFKEATPPASLVFGLVDQILFRREEARAGLDADYGLPPRAGPDDLFFRVKDVFDGVNSTLRNLAAHGPYLTYMHLWAPHEPYRPAEEFRDLFKDGFRPIKKPDHRFGDYVEFYKLMTHRRIYDQYIANVDAEFGRLIDRLERDGVLDNTYIVVTTDHGQSFERGVEFHLTKLLYEPLMHIPLLISSPGQTQRKDIHTPTNAVDLLPTLLQLVGRPVPDWVEGTLLPELGGVADEERSLFTMEAKTNRAFAPLTEASVAMVKGDYKLIYYTGYEAEDSFEFYNLADDYEELNDLYPSQPAVLKIMKDELIEKLNSVNAKYRRS
jgi:arylsulfatase A-like enzyme